MSAESQDSSARERRVDEVIAAYLELADTAQAPDPREYMARYPDIADELMSFFSNRDGFDRLANPLKSVRTDDERRTGGAAPQTFPESPAPTNGDAFGDYELLNEIARGGMGVVYKARQVRLNRIVALKMILTGHLASPEDVQRFYGEAQAAANLDHPGIVPVYEVGEHDGQHYFSMGYVHGHSLAELVRDGPLPSSSAARILRQVCDAVQYAHEHNVIHRDLKPANILLETTSLPENPGTGRPPILRPDCSIGSKPRFENQEHADSEPAATGESSITLNQSRPRITDFGLAKRLKNDANLTGTGQILGTPNYMSPEQAAGMARRVGPASDIYSLGAILYQLLTGRPPFQAETPWDTLSQLLEADPVPPRLLNANVPRDLETICMKCLEKEPARRYGSARELGDELQRFLEGEPIRTAGTNLLDRMTRILRQSRHEEHFRGWGLGLMAFGFVIFLSHVAIFALERTWGDSWATYLLPRTAMFAALLVMLWRFRHNAILPTRSAERLIWVVWIGYLLALGAVNATRSMLGHEQAESYAAFAILTGFGFLIMGEHVWGGGYLVGLVFMIAAPVLAKYVDVAPLAFGALWAGALLVFGLHYWRRGRLAEDAQWGAHQ